MHAKSESTPTHDAPAILRACLEATGRSQVRLAIDVFGVNDRSLRDWLAGAPCWPPIVRLAWLLARHPELADELAGEFADEFGHRSAE